MSDRTRIVPDDEDVSIDLMLEKYNQGAIWYGSTDMNIGWPDELQVGGPNLIRLLTRLRDDYDSELRAVREALDSHRVPAPDGLSQADRIHLLVGRKTR